MYMYKQDLALNNLQYLICNKNKQNQKISFPFLRKSHFVNTIVNINGNYQKLHLENFSSLISDMIHPN